MEKIKIDISVIESLFPFSFVTDREGKIVKAAPSMKKLFGVSFETQTFSTIFQVQRPSGLDYSKIIANHKPLALLWPDLTLIATMLLEPNKADSFE